MELNKPITLGGELPALQRGLRTKRMVDVKMDERQRRTVESYPEVYAPLKQLVF
jgi:hypothetical protein